MIKKNITFQWLVLILSLSQVAFSVSAERSNKSPPQVIEELDRLLFSQNRELKDVKTKIKNQNKSDLILLHNLLKLETLLEYEQKKIKEVLTVCRQEARRPPEAPTCVNKYDNLMVDLEKRWLALGNLFGGKLADTPNQPGKTTLIALAKKVMLSLGLVSASHLIPFGTESLLSQSKASASKDTVLNPMGLPICPKFTLVEQSDPACQSNEPKYIIPTLEGFEAALKAAQITLEPYQSKYLFDLFPGARSISPLEKKGINTALVVEDSSGKKQFVKLWFSEEAKLMGGADDFLAQFASLHEASASQLASRLSDGLVPAGETQGGLAIVYPMMPIDSPKTDALFVSRYPKHVKEDIFPKLNDKQREQAFVHSVIDLLLDNRDTHAGQFAIDKSGNFIGFDKGRSHMDEIFQKTLSQPLFELDASTLKKSDVYGNFIQHLQTNTSQLGKILNSERVTMLFERIDTITDDEILSIMTPLFRYLDYRIKKDKLAFSVSEFQTSYIQRFRKIRTALSSLYKLRESEFKSYFDWVSAKDVLDMKITASGIRYVTADLSKFDVRVISTNDFTSNGAYVKDTLTKMRAIAGINGGYFQNTDVSALQNTFLGKAFYYGMNIVRRHTGLGADLFKVFPSQILKTETHLVGDSGELYPCFGWNLETKQFIAGEVRTQWLLYPGPDFAKKVKPLEIERVSHLHYKDKFQYLFTGKSRIEIENGFITNIVAFEKTPHFGAVEEYNAYRFKSELDAAQTNWVQSLKAGNPLSIDYRFVGENDEETAKWALVNQVVNGQGVLVKKGVAQPIREKNEGIGFSSASEKTALCSTGDGKMMQFVSKSISFDDFARDLARLGCQEALSLDGGVSTSMVLKEPNGLDGFISDRAISDVIVIMPKAHSSSIAKMRDSFPPSLVSMVRSGDVASFRFELRKNPKILTQKESGRTLMHLVIDEGSRSNFAAAKELLEFIKNNSAYESIANSKNFFNETPLVTALGKLEWKDSALALNTSNANLTELINDLTLYTNLPTLDEDIALILLQFSSATKNGLLADRIVKDLDSYALTQFIKKLGSFIGPLIDTSAAIKKWALANKERLNSEYDPAFTSPFSLADLAEIHSTGDCLVSLAITKGKFDLAERMISRTQKINLQTSLEFSIEKGNFKLANLLAARFPSRVKEIDLLPLFLSLKHADSVQLKAFLQLFEQQQISKALVSKPELLLDYDMESLTAIAQQADLTWKSYNSSDEVGAIVFRTLLPSFKNKDPGKLKAMLQLFEKQQISKVLDSKPELLLDYDMESLTAILQQADLTWKKYHFSDDIGTIVFRTLLPSLKNKDPGKLKAILQLFAKQQISEELVSKPERLLDYDMESLTAILQQADLTWKRYNSSDEVGTILLRSMLLSMNNEDPVKLKAFLQLFEKRHFEAEYFADNLLFKLVNEEAWKNGATHERTLKILLEFFTPEQVAKDTGLGFTALSELLKNSFANDEAIRILALHTTTDDLWANRNLKYLLAKWALHNLAKKTAPLVIIETLDSELSVVASNLEKLNRVVPKDAGTPSKKLVDDYDYHRNKTFANYLKKMSRDVGNKVQQVLRKHGLEFKGVEY